MTTLSTIAQIGAVMFIVCIAISLILFMAMIDYWGDRKAVTLVSRLHKVNLLLMFDALIMICCNPN